MLLARFVVPPSKWLDRGIQNFGKKTTVGTLLLSFLMTCAQIEVLKAGTEMFSGLDYEVHICSV